MAETVAVLGGGVAGLTAAHELADRGFQVALFEARDRAGGKARSYPYPGSGSDGRGDLPAEHGFRFFPGFYRHVPDTMRRIPAAGGTDVVLDHLVATTEILFAQEGGRNEIVAPARAPGSLDDLDRLSRFLKAFTDQVGIPAHEYVVFMERMLTLLTSCDERRYGQWERQSWWQFVDAERRSPAFQKFVADGLTRTLVAARAREMSARTGGYILLQILFDAARAGGAVDRVLDAPTSDVWIDPWIEHLRARGVDVCLEHEVTGIAVREGRVGEVTVTAGGTDIVVHADHYVAALPVEVMSNLVTREMRDAEPRLAGLPRLVTRWMNGVMFYLDRDVALRHGHTLFIDSDWALTSISQRQFWRTVDLRRLGDGRVEGILSVCVSDWERTSRRTGKVAMQSTADEIKHEVWEQLKDHLNDDPVQELEDANRLDAFLDSAITFPNPTQAANLEPLLINTNGSWDDRPEAVTAIPNLFLASDYVRTFTDLATMEGANEAGRRAVNGILDRSAMPARRCEVWPLREPGIFAPARALDRVRWKLFRRPARSPLRVREDGGVEPTGPVGRVLTGVLPRARRR